MIHQEKGFIALFSVIIITMVLLLMAAGLSFSGFFGRFNVLDTESKKQSDELANGCIDSAIFKIAEDPSFVANNMCISVGDTCPNGKNICTIVSSLTSGSIATIITNGTIQNTETYYKAIVDTTTSKITSFQELSTYP